MLISPSTRRVTFNLPEVPVSHSKKQKIIQETIERIFNSKSLYLGFFGLIVGGCIWIFGPKNYQPLGKGVTAVGGGLVIVLCTLQGLVGFCRFQCGSTFVDATTDDAEEKI